MKFIRFVLFFAVSQIPFILNSEPIHEYAKKGDLAGVEAEMQKWQSVNEVDNAGRTALHWAVQYGHAYVVRSLLEQGANTDIVDAEGFTVPQLAQGGPLIAIVLGVEIRPVAHVKAESEDSESEDASSDDFTLSPRLARAMFHVEALTASGKIPY